MENNVAIDTTLPFWKYNHWAGLYREVKKEYKGCEKTPPSLRVHSMQLDHIKQQLFHKSNSRCRFVFGGNRTGKSECGAMEAVSMALGYHLHKETRKNTTGWVVSLTRQVQRDVAQEKILKYLPKKNIKKIVMVAGSNKSPEYGIIDFIIVTNANGGESKIGFRNCEQGRERFQGVSLDWVWFDEEPPEDIYDECILRLIDRGGTHWATMTPLKGRSWVYRRIYLNDRKNGIECFFMTWEDNPYLSKEEITLMENTLSPDVLEARKYGRFYDKEGLVFPEFTSANIITPFDTSALKNKFVSIDPGYTNPTAVLWIATDTDDNIYVTADYEVSYKTVAEHSQTIKQKTNELGWKLADTKILIDSAAKQRTTAGDTSTANLYRENGINVDTHVSKSVFTGIMKIKSLFCNSLNKRKLFVFASCTNLINEIHGYYWGENDNPRKQNDHTIDALRYCVMHITKQQSEYNSQNQIGFLGLIKQSLINSYGETNLGISANRRHT